jgi:SagB-type dehydrogenase family enzyme
MDKTQVDKTKQRRDFLKASSWKVVRASGHVSDQMKGIPPPPVQKPYPEDATLIVLVQPEKITVGNAPLRETIGRRRSRREYTKDPLSLEELSYLLWATQGVTEVYEMGGGIGTRRTVPSGGSRHTFETYLGINRVEGISPGLYRYLPLDHKLVFLYSDPKLPRRLAAGCLEQDFVADAAVVFAWTTIPYRMEWRYTIVSPKIIALDAGHVCQNLYLAAESIGAGMCAIAAYDQEEMDAILQVDGVDEFTIYVAPVGKHEGNG